MLCMSHVVRYMINFEDVDIYKLTLGEIATSQMRLVKFHSVTEGWSRSARTFNDRTVFNLANMLSQSQTPRGPQISAEMFSISIVFLQPGKRSKRTWNALPSHKAEDQAVCLVSCFSSCHRWSLCLELRPLRHRRVWTLNFNCHSMS